MKIYIVIQIKETITTEELIGCDCGCGENWETDYCIKTEKSVVLATTNKNKALELQNKALEDIKTQQKLNILNTRKNNKLVKEFEDKCLAPAREHNKILQDLQKSWEIKYNYKTQYENYEHKEFNSYESFCFNKFREDFYKTEEGKKHKKAEKGLWHLTKKQITEKEKIRNTYPIDNTKLPKYSVEEVELD